MAAFLRARRHIVAFASACLIAPACADDGGGHDGASYNGSAGASHTHEIRLSCP